MAPEFNKHEGKGERIKSGIPTFSLLLYPFFVVPFLRSGYRPRTKFESPTEGRNEEAENPWSV